MPEGTVEETVEDLTLLERLRRSRAALVNEASTLTEQRIAERAPFEKRVADSDESITDEERSAFAAAEESFSERFAGFESQIGELDKRIREQEMIERRRQEAAQASAGSVRVVSEPATYRADNADEYSYFRDLCVTDEKVAQSLHLNPTEARERLARHAKETESWLPKREAERRARAERQIEEAEFESRRAHGHTVRGFNASPFERRVNPNRTDGQGGYFVPPLWLVDEYIPGLRAGRVAANLARQMTLPEGTDSINIPKLSTLTKVDVQPADTAPVASQDFTDTSVQANVKTIAGQEDVAIQLIEQSPGQIVDRVVMEDLIRDYDRRIDQQVIYGNGTNSAALNGGQVLGIFPATNWSGTNSVTWTSATPTGLSYAHVQAALASKVAQTGFDLQGFALLQNPRRWFWYASYFDGAGGTAGTSGRPLVNPQSTSVNVAAYADPTTPFEGLVGTSLYGAREYISANVPATADTGGTTTIGGTNDVAIGAVWDDLWLFEGNLRTRVLSEVLSGTLEIRFQVYNYIAFLVRYGQSLAIASGTGFAAPTSAIDSSITF
jgi:hypothetical protein